jgi:hypothetical protein
MIKAFDVCNILLHIMLISAFLGSYFFTFGAYLEREVLKDQLNFLVDTTLHPVRILFPNMSNDIKQKIKQQKFILDEKADKNSEENNKKTVDMAIKFITIFFVIGFIVILFLSKILDKEGLTTMQFLKKLFMHNLIILIFIAMTEFIFAFFFAKKYMSLDTNKLKKQIFISLDKIKNTEVPKMTNKEKASALYTESKNIIETII